MACGLPATVRVLVVKLAVVTPPEVVTLTGPPELTPSTANCTVPVGVPAPEPVTATVAVKVTAWLGADGLTEDVTVVLVVALLTVWLKVALVPPAKVASPL